MSLSKALVNNIMSFTHGGPEALEENKKANYFYAQQLPQQIEMIDELQDEIQYWKRVICGREDGYMYMYSLTSPWLELNNCCRALADANSDRTYFLEEMNKALKFIFSYEKTEETAEYVVNNYVLKIEKA